MKYFILCLCYFLLIYSTIHPCTSLSTDEGRVHTVANFIGGDASMPCEVDLTGCGDIYFITWTKNVSNDWQRVFLYSQSYKKVLGDFEIYAQNRVHFKGDTINTTGIAYLTITSLDIVDEGVYKCDVTYTRPNINGKCPSLTYTRLHTLVKPGNPIIRVNGHAITHFSKSTALLTNSNNSNNNKTIDSKHNAFKTNELLQQIGPFAESSTIVFECASSGGRPLPEVKWWNGTKPMRSKITVLDDDTDGPTVMSTMRIIATRYDLGAKFECRVWNNATITPLFQWIRLDIQVKPLSLKVRGPTQAVVAGEMVSLTCSVEGARPAANITWYNRSEVVTPHPSASTDLMSDGTYRTSSTLVFIASRHDHSGDFFCKGSNQVLRSRNEVPLLQGIHLQVLYPPAVAIQPVGTIAVNETSSVQMWCTFDANPPNVTEIVWYKDGQTLNWNKLTKNKINTGTDVRGIPTLTINNINRNDSAKYGCHLKNAFGRGNSITFTELQVTYPPVVTIELDPYIVVESSTSIVRLRCVTIEGNPRQLALVHWFLNGELVETTYGDQLDGQSADQLIMSNVSRTQAGNYSCQGYNGAANASRVSAAKQLTVHYPPGEASLRLTDGLTFAIKGSVVSLECQFNYPGHPQADSYVWTHNGKRIEPLTDQKNVYRTGPSDVSTRGEYSCAAINFVGQGKWAHFWLEVKSPPRLVQGLEPSVGSLANRSLSFSCRVECHPLCSINWFRNNQSLDPNSNVLKGVYYRIETVEHEIDDRNGVFGSITSYLHLHNSSSLDDNDVFQCQSDDNGIGPAVSSTMIYRLEYPPHNVQISVPRLELMEGDPIGDDLIYCNALANPIANYYWTTANSDHIITIGRYLTFNVSSSRVTRDHSGNYTCVVTNRHGMATQHMTITVLYRPECQMRREYIFDGRPILACDAQSNPSVINFTWYKGNKTVSEVSRPDQTDVVVDVKGSKQSSVFVLADTDVEAYYCIATNAIGQSKACRLHVQQIANAPSGWVQTLLADENLIIVAATAGAVVFLLASSLVILVICAAKRKLKGLTGINGLSTRHTHLDSGQSYSSTQAFNRFSANSSMNSVQSNRQKSASFALINQLPILEERSIPDGRCTALSINDMDCNSSTLCTPTQKSPLISSAMSQCVQLSQTQPDGSPLLLYSDDYHSDDNDDDESPTPLTSSSESVQHHFYERPHHYENRSLHNIHYNIPPPRPPPPPLICPTPPHRIRHYSYSSRDNYDYHIR